MNKYIPITEEERQAMLDFIGISNIDELFSVIPPDSRLQELNLPEGMSEMEVEKYFQSFYQTETPILFAGGGVADHWIPAAVDSITGRGEFYTAYTPYQAEVSQGTLQTIYEYQSLIVNLTGMEVSNASMYDGPTALAEAILMLFRIFKKKNKVLLASNIYRNWKEVIKTYFSGMPFVIEEVKTTSGSVDIDDLTSKIDDTVAGFVYQTPNALGFLENAKEIGKLLQEKGIGHVVAVDPLSLSVCKSPAEFGADIIVGEGQPLGQPLSFGGPYFGFFATREKYIKQMPGRVVGKTVDADGKEAYVLTFQTREQHIRRARATSNICSNQALCALRATVYMSLLGGKGLFSLANQIMEKSHYLYNELLKIEGVEPLFKDNQMFFKEFPIRVKNAVKVREKILEAGFFAGLLLQEVADYTDSEDVLVLCVTEKRDKAEIDSLLSLFKKVINGV